MKILFSFDDKILRVILRAHELSLGDGPNLVYVGSIKNLHLSKIINSC